MKQRNREQYGYIKTENGRYTGYWYEYEQCGDKRARRKRSKVLGRTGEILEAEARGRLAWIIRKIGTEHQFDHLEKSPVISSEIVKLSNDSPRWQQKGGIGELVVAADLLARGCDVFRSVTHCSGCDLVAIHDGAIYRVEVKVADRNERGVYSRNLKLKPGAYDLLAVVSRDMATVYYEGERYFA